MSPAPLRATVLVATLLLVALAAPAARADGIGNAGGDDRTGWYPDQPRLGPGTVSASNFGRIFAQAVDGQVYAQPLVAAGTLVVATESNTVYGLDPATGHDRWHRNVGQPFRADQELGCGDLAPNIGITSTPVIDQDANGTSWAYFAAKVVAGASVGYWVHAVNVASGVEKPGFPVEVRGTADNAPDKAFDARTQLQRAGLLLLDGVVYVAFGGHCDHPTYQGWVAGVSTGPSPHVTALWTSQAGATANGAGIWQSGAGLMSDGPGRIFVITGNGGSPSEPAPGNAPPAGLGQAAIRLDVAGGKLVAHDFFSPYDAGQLDDWDADFGSSGIAALPGATFGTPAYPHLAVTAGKQGYVYLLDRDDLGGFRQGPSDSDAVLSRLGPRGGVWSRPAVWPGDGGFIYIPTASDGTTAWGTSGYLEGYQVTHDGNGRPQLVHAARSADTFGFSSGAPIVTSDGTSSGSALVWTVWSPDGSGVGGQLRAYDPVPDASGRLQQVKALDLGDSTYTGQAAKFAPPGVGDGRLYVGTRDGHVVGFGSPVSATLGGNALSFPATTLGTTSAPRTATFTANAPVTVDAIASAKPDFQVGQPSRPLPARLAAGDTISVPVSFAPATAGVVNAALTAQTHAGQSVTLGMTGVGRYAGPVLKASPTVLSMGGTTIGSTTTDTVTLRNAGDTALDLVGLDRPAPGSPFTVTGGPDPAPDPTRPFTIAAGGSLTLTVSYAPTATGSFSDELAARATTTDGTPLPSVTTTLTGTATTPPHAVVEPLALDFGALAPGEQAVRAFTVRNDGGGPFTVTRSKPPAGGAFTAATQLPEGTRIPAGASVDESVVFAPAALGAFSDTWALNGNDDVGPRSVALSGAGIAPAQPSDPDPAPAAPAPGPTYAPVTQGQSVAHAARTTQVTIGSGSAFARRLIVTVGVAAPPGATSMSFSNAASFAPAKTFRVATQHAWTLADGRDGARRTVYVRFGGVAGVFADDVILDRLAPVVTGASARAAAPARGTAAAPGWWLSVRARDATSGAVDTHVAARRDRPQAWTTLRALAAVPGPRPRWVRVRDRAGNVSRWAALRSR